VRRGIRSTCNTEPVADQIADSIAIGRRQGHAAGAVGGPPPGRRPSAPAFIRHDETICLVATAGLVHPSQSDGLITHGPREALALIDVRVLDFLIVAGSDAVSLAERGALQTKRLRPFLAAPGADLVRRKRPKRDYRERQVSGHSPI
jgi:hypothetical protein